MKKETIDAEFVRRSQRLHAMAVFIFSLLGAIAAIVMIVESGIAPSNLALLLVMYIFTMAGITVGFHRFLSHRSFQTGRTVRAVLTILGSMTAQGPPIYWVGTHRRHHQFSDRPGDIHSPYFKDNRSLNLLPGLWHSHIGWVFDQPVANPIFYCKDLLSDPIIRMVNRFYFVWVFLGLLIPAIIGGGLNRSWIGCFSGFLWGGIVRIFLTSHAISSVNSICHSFGIRPFNTAEQSRNNRWLALPTFGEAWHNNHHAFPTSAFHGFKWWQLDPAGWTIRLLEKTGLIWDVKRTTKAQREEINKKYGGISNAEPVGSEFNFEERERQPRERRDQRVAFSDSGRHTEDRAIGD